MTNGIQELIEYVKLVERTSGHDNIQIKSILDYAERMKEKDFILTKTIVKRCIIEVLLTCDEPRKGSLNNYFDEIYNKIALTYE